MVSWLVICSLAAGCASFRSPLLAPTPPDPVEARQLTIEALRTQPNGLVLRLGAHALLPVGARLQVLRFRGDEPATLLQEIELAAPLASHLSEEGIVFVDRQVEPHTDYTYGLRALLPDGEPPDELLSHPLALRLDDFPPPAAEFEVDASSSKHVTLRWNAHPGLEALIYRRDLIAENAAALPLALVAPQAAAIFIDADVTAGGVYTYRMVFVDRRSQIAHYGDVSEEIYVTVPLD
ncbi:MAG: hypothetical protein H0U74_13035 [Bradymonadaceae bacterium]|nr:hypothetical protein [Lujinxingiaceae bacterium]